MTSDDKLSLVGSVSLGTVVMIGAGIFALVGQVGELAGTWMPFACLAGAVVVSFSAYSYVKYSNANPSSGGIAMLLKAAYGLASSPARSHCSCTSRWSWPKVCWPRRSAPTRCDPSASRTL